MIFLESLVELLSLFHFFNNGALMYSLSPSLCAQFWRSVSEDSSLRSVPALVFAISKSSCSWNTFLVKLHDS